MQKPKCHDCKRKFRTAGALAMHMKDKHPHHASTAKPRRKPRWGAFFGCLAFIAAIMVAIANVKAIEANTCGVATLNKLWAVTVTPTKR